MRKCKVCGKRFRLLAKNKYEIVKSPVGVEALVQGTVYYEAFDCPTCGCQNIVNVRELGGGGRRMTLDEAIEYEEEMVEIGETYEINKGMLEEYRQFTEWLKDYKRLLEQQPILDNIRAEIESNMESIIGKYDSNTPARDMPSAKIERNSARMEVLEIIDKYKAESEDKE